MYVALKIKTGSDPIIYGIYSSKINAQKRIYKEAKKILAHKTGDNSVLQDSFKERAGRKNNFIYSFANEKIMLIDIIESQAYKFLIKEGGFVYE